MSIISKIKHILRPNQPNIIKQSDDSAALSKDRELMRMVNFCVGLLLESDVENQAGAMADGMGMIGSYVDVDRVTVWQNHRLDDGRLYYKLVCEWANKGLPPLDTETLFAYEDVLPDWETKFTMGISVNGPIDSLSESERAQLEIFGLKSILAVPISFRNELWGFVSFDDYRNMRYFPEGEANVLHSWGLLVVGNIQRSEVTLMMRQTLIDLEAALESAQAANRAKTAFLSNMSHEIRTPINAIVGMTTIGKSATDIEQKNACFSKVENASKHLLGVINDILDMSKIEANKFELSLAPFNFKKMLDGVVNVLNFRIDEKHQKLKVNVDNSIPTDLIGDKQRLAQIITNLLGNSIKFTPEHGFIQLDARHLGDENDMCNISISVKDTGIGISPENQKNLFEAFNQAESTTSRKFGGTGLGLSISKNLVEMMHGEIMVDSEVGKGSTFTFTVKMERALAAADISENGNNYNAYTSEDNALEHTAFTDNNEKTSASVFASASTSDSDSDNTEIDINGIFKGYSILLAEDIEINREIVLALLEPTGLQIDCAQNGVEVVEMFIENENVYHMILMDLQMPVMDGLEATQKIRALGTEKSQSIPIIALTANVFKEDIENCLAIGMNGHVGKPIDLDEVIEVLREYIQ